MTDPDVTPRARPFSAGLFEMSRGGGGEALAAGLTVVWVLVVLAFWILAGIDGAAGGMLALLSVVLPVGMIWVTVLAVRSARAMQDEALHLRDTVEALRRAQAEAGQIARAVRPIEQKLDRLAMMQDQGRQAAPSAPSPAAEARPDEPALFPAPEKAPVLDLPTLIVALNFPVSEDDRAGFRALGAALAHPRARRIMQAAEDVLTLMSSAGLYMDDFAPAPAHPRVWRRFADGTRDATIADLGGIRDPEAVATVGARMREDPVFRDAAHHFLRAFDRMLAALAPEADDDDIARLSDTRSARAFMLVGRAAGLFPDP